MARPLKPLIRGGGYYPSRKWTPLVYNGGYTTMDGGGEPPTPIYWKTITGVSPLVLANALAEHIRSITQIGKCTQSTTPTPSAPVDIMTNNGALRFGWLDVITTSQLSGYGTYVSPSGTAGNRAYKWFKDLPNGTYQFSVEGDYEIIVQWRDPADPSNIVPTSYENLSGWITSGEVVLDKEGGGYGIAVRRTSGTSSITPSNFDGTLHVQERGLYLNGTPEVLTVSGKNLFNKNDSQVGKNWNGNNMGYSIASGYIPAKKGGAFTLSISDMPKYTSTTWVVLNSNYVYIGTVNNGSPITQDACAYIRLSIRCADTDSWTQSDLENAKIQLERGSTATAYEPYVTPQTVNDVPMLLSVGDVKDEAELIEGIKTGKVGVKVFDGTETIGTSNACFTIAISDRVTAKTALLCSHFPYSSKTSSQTDDCTIISFSSTNIGFRFDACADKTAFAAFLAAEYAAGHPVIVVYPLATEQTEQTTPHSLHSYAGTTVVDAATNVDPVTLSAEYASSEE